MGERPVAGMLLEVDALQLGSIGTNCYLVREAGERHALLVDPGAEPERVLALLDQHDVELQAILVTHCHYDHVGAVAAVAAETGVEVWMSATEAPVLEQPERFAVPGLPSVAAWRVDHRLHGGERIEVAGLAIDVLAVPGHSPGHLAFVLDGVRDASGEGYEAPPTCFVGDVVFRGSVGRTDLPFADGEQLQRSLELLARRLAPETVLRSGHGPATSMAHELATNPFLRGL